MCADHIQKLDNLLALLDIDHMILFPHYYFGTDFIKHERLHQLFCLLGVAAHKFQMVPLLRVADRAGAQKGAAQKRALAAKAFDHKRIYELVALFVFDCLERLIYDTNVIF